MQLLGIKDNTEVWIMFIKRTKIKKKKLNSVKPLVTNCSADELLLGPYYSLCYGSYSDFDTLQSKSMGRVRGRTLQLCEKPACYYKTHDGVHKITKCILRFSRIMYKPSQLFIYNSNI